MNFHQSDVFLQDLSNSFIVGSTLLIFIPEYLNYLVVFLVVILCIWRPKKNFPPYLAPFSSRFVVLVRDHPLIIFFECEISFHLSRAIQESFQFDSPEAIISELFIPAFSSHTPNFTGASFKWSLISSWSLRSHVSRFSRASSFICKFFPVFLYLLFVHF